MVKKYKLDAYDSLVCKEDGYLIYYEDYQALEAENQRLREALEEIANGKPPKSIYGEGIYWWCVETAKKALEHNDE